MTLVDIEISLSNLNQDYLGHPHHNMPSFGSPNTTLHPHVFETGPHPPLWIYKA